ncbi:MAG: hypothetical protein B2I17_05955 [Thermoplasmatales archaeon B_DKE]|nr:MAG: hypothetical protein B2I17_05955 [Thermoplasmatales archaeon B_DKE]
MNSWAQRSIDIANNGNYLDQLKAIYRIDIPGMRDIDPELVREIAIAHSKKDARNVFIKSLDLPVFPIEHPYVAFIRYDPDKFIKLNPQVVEYIGNAILALRIDEILLLGAKAKRPVKRYGQAFKSWLLSLPYRKLDIPQFSTVSLGSNEIVICDESDQEYEDFANSQLRCGLVKAPDLLLRKGDKYILGEAKFLSDLGGGQDRNFSDAMDMVNNHNGNAHRIAVLDGPLWLNGPDRNQTRGVRNTNADVMSALVLQDFISHF